MSKARFVFFSSHTFFPEAALIQQIQTQSYKGRDVPPFLLSALQGLPRPSTWGHWTLGFAQSPSFRTLRYHNSPWAEQLLSSLGLLRTRPFTLQDVNYQLSSGFNGTGLQSRSAIEMLINSNQYQILCLKWAAGSKMCSPAHLEYKGKTTGPEISLPFKSRLAGVTLRSSGTAGMNLNQLAKGMGFDFQYHPHNYFH